MPPLRFSLADEDLFRALLARPPRVLALFRGVGCPYSATFEPAFAMQIAPPAGWVLAIREVEEGGHGPVAEARRVDVTPTVVAFEGGEERARLDGRLLIGITRTSYQRWLKTLG